MSISFANKLKLIRTAIGKDQQVFAQLIDVADQQYATYESGQRDVCAQVLKKICSHPECVRYTLWLMTDQTNAGDKASLPCSSGYLIDSRRSPIRKLLLAKLAFWSWLSFGSVGQICPTFVVAISRLISHDAPILFCCIAQKTFQTKTDSLGFRWLTKVCLVHMETSSWFAVSPKLVGMFFGNRGQAFLKFQIAMLRLGRRWLWKLEGIY